MFAKTQFGMTRRTLFQAFFLSALLAPGVALAAPKAVIVFNDGRTQEVDRITRATYKEVAYKIGGGRQTEKASIIRDVYPPDADFSAGIAAFNERKIGRAIGQFKRATRSRDDTVKPFAQYFLARSQMLGGQLGDAAKNFEAFTKANGDHFYAPRAYYQGGECYRALGQFKQAEAFYKSLNKFGSDWGDRGAYGKGVCQLAQGKAKDAASTFSKLARNSSGDTKNLAKIGEARALTAQGKGSSAKGKVTTLLRGRDVTPAVSGLGYVALGEIQLKDSKNRDALKSFLRSLLLYGGESSFGDAKSGAAKAAQAMKAGGLVGRIRGFPAGVSYTGKKPNAEFVTQLMRVSAALAEEEAKALMASASPEEKGDLAFLRADALRYMNKMEEYKKAIADAQKKYPNHSRAGDVKVDLFFSTFANLQRRLTKAKDETDSDKKKTLLDGIHKDYDVLLADFKKVRDATTADCEKTIESIEEMKEKYTDANVAKLRRRDLLEYKYCEILYHAALSYKKSADKRGELLNTAYTAIDNFTLDRGENYSFDLLANAYKLKGQILMEQGKAAEAVFEFEGLKEYVAPIRVNDPNVMKKVKEFERGVRISGYRLFASACSRAKQFEKAIEAFDQLEKNIPGYEKSREGLLAMFELTTCLAGVGRTTEALEKIWPIVEDPKSVKVEGINPEGLKVEACKALAGISDAAGGEIFPPEIQFMVGFGYTARGDDEAAIVGYKGVLTSAVSREDREEWVPKAVKEMGTLLYYQGRYLEAVLAYRTVPVEFPEHPEALDNIKFAKTAVAKALSLYGESDADKGPIYALKKELDELLIRLDEGGKSASTIIFKEAAGLQGKGQFLQAAKKYMDVPEFVEQDGKKVRVKVFANALANAGYCYFKQAEKTKKKELMDDAQKTLSRALKIAEETKDDKSLAVASYYLGELYNANKKHDKAIEALKLFDGRLKKLKSFRVRARAQQVTAYLALGKNKQAEKRFEDVEGEKGGLLIGMAVDLAQWYAISASKAKGETASEYRRQAGKYAMEYVNRSKRLSRSSVMWAASIINDGGQAEKAVEIYEKLFQDFPRPKMEDTKAFDKGEKQMDIQTSYDLAELSLARAYLNGKKYDKAYAIFSKLKKLALVSKKRRRGNEEIFALFYRGELVSSKKERVKGPSGDLRQKVYQVKLGDGKEQSFMVPPKKAAPTVVIGKDATKVFSRSDYYILRQRFKNNYYVLEGLAKSAWGNYQQNKDKNYLVNEVQKAWNELFFYLKKAIDESSYVDLIENYSLKEKNYDEKWMGVALRLTEIAFERQDFKKVVSDVDVFKRQGLDKAVSSELWAKFEALKAKAASK